MFWSAFISFFLSFFVTVPFKFILNYVPGPIGNLLSMIFFFIFFFFLFTRPIVRYMRMLADGLISIAQGNLDYRVPMSRQDELGYVAHNINYMAEQLQSIMIRERQVEMSKMELITNVSHDLRTPLTSIIGYLNLLKNDDYRDLNEHKRYIQNAFNKTEQLKKLIDDLFEYTRLTSGAIVPDLKTIDLCGLLEQILTETEPLIQENGLQLEKVLEKPEIPGRVDAEQLVRAIDNLLMNAIKFSRKPGVITVRLAEHEHYIRLAVENVGEPITGEEEKLLFERFYKADPARSVQDMPPGSGLGLSIARNIVELHGGQIGLVHRNGHYSFYMELPTAR